MRKSVKLIESVTRIEHDSDRNLLSTNINCKFSGITKDDLLECAARNNIKNAAQIIDEVCQTTSGWPEIAQECEVPQKMIEAIRPNMVFF